MQGWGSVFRIRGSRSWPVKDIQNIIIISFLNNLQVLFYLFIIFCVRRSIDALDPENQPGSGSDKIWNGSGSRALRLTENVGHQKYENKKEIRNYLEFSFNSILNISYRSGYRALDPTFCQNRILIPVYMPPPPLRGIKWKIFTPTVTRTGTPATTRLSSPTWILTAANDSLQQLTTVDSS